MVKAQDRQCGCSSKHADLDYDARSLEALINSRLDQLQTIPHGKATGRRLEFRDTSHAEWETIIRRGMESIASTLSSDVIVRVPAVVLEQVIIRAISQNQDAAVLIMDLIQSFLMAYATPESSQAAFERQQELVDLRANLDYARVAMRD